jgi:hypothetical protein
MTYLTVKPTDTAETVIRMLNSKYGLDNLYPMMAPVKLIGSAKVLTMRSLKRNEIIKLDGPGMIINRVYEKIISIR